MQRRISEEWYALFFTKNIPKNIPAAVDEQGCHRLLRHAIILFITIHREYTARSFHVLCMI